MKITLPLITMLTISIVISLCSAFKPAHNVNKLRILEELSSYHAGIIEINSIKCIKKTDTSSHDELILEMIINDTNKGIEREYKTKEYELAENDHVQIRGRFPCPRLVSATFRVREVDTFQDDLGKIVLPCDIIPDTFKVGF